MKTTMLIFLVCFSHSAFAETYKCIQSGKTIYSSFPCGDNAQAVVNHITTIDGLPHAINQEPNSVQTAPVQSVVAPVQVVEPVKVAIPIINCDYEEAEFEAVKKVMRAGFTASQANYLHDRFVQTRDAYDLCRERLQKNLSKK